MEEFEFKLFRALLGAEDFVLDLLQLGRDEALGVGHRLLAVVVRRGTAEVGFGDLDEISEDRVVADLERLDPGGLDLAGLELGDPVLPPGPTPHAIHRAPHASRRGCSRRP